MVKRIVCICGIQLALFLLMAHFRFIDIDEGYYLSAARLVAEGKLPYLDFFYTQMPLMPYVQAGWMSLFGFSWMGARSLSVLCALAITIVIAGYTYKRTGSATVATVVSLIFIGNGQAISWFSTAKTYAPTALCVVGAIALLSSRKEAHVFFAGLALGLGIAMRLMLLPLLPLSMAWLVYCARRLGPLRAARPALICAAGAAIPFLPAGYLLWRAPDAFLFNTVFVHASHAQLFSGSFFRALHMKSQGLFYSVANPQTLLIILGLLGSVFALRADRAASRRRDAHTEEILCGLYLATLGVVSLIPDHTQQYSVMCVPVAALFCGAFTGAVVRDANALLRRLSVAAGILYLALAAPASGTLGGIGDPADRVWKIPSAEKIAQRVEELTRPEDVVLAFWPGYTFLAGRKNLPGMENDFGYSFAADGLPDEASKRYHISTGADLCEAIRRRVPALIVWEWGWHPGYTHKAALEAALHDAYVPAETVGQTVLYRRASEGT